MCAGGCGVEVVIELGYYRGDSVKGDVMCS